MTAAFCLSAAPAGAATVSATAHHAAAGPTAASSTTLTALRQTAAEKAHETQLGHEAHLANISLPTRYTVKSGDSLATIAQRFYHNPDAWPVLYWANHRQIKWANEIQAGQVLNVPAKPSKIPAAPAQLGPQAAPAPVQASVAVQSAPVQSASVQSAAPVAQAAPAATYSGSGSFQSCVIARESGGSSQVMNSSGHYGLYQFSASTWAAYGGSPASFGSASVAQQNQVFNNAIAAGGQSNWSAYDGC